MHSDDLGFTTFLAKYKGIHLSDCDWRCFVKLLYPLADLLTLQLQAFHVFERLFFQKRKVKENGPLPEVKNHSYTTLRNPSLLWNTVLFEIILKQEESHWIRGAQSRPACEIPRPYLLTSVEHPWFFMELFCEFPGSQTSPTSPHNPRYSCSISLGKVLQMHREYSAFSTFLWKCSLKHVLLLSSKYNAAVAGKFHLCRRKLLIESSL